MANCGMKATELSEKANVSKGYVSEILKGVKKSPSFPTCKKIADVLSVSPAWLLYGEEAPASVVLRKIGTDGSAGEVDVFAALREIEVASPDTVITIVKLLLDGRAANLSGLTRDFFGNVGSLTVMVMKLAEWIRNLEDQDPELAARIRDLDPEVKTTARDLERLARATAEGAPTVEKWLEVLARQVKGILKEK